jgi:hypothetical protein
LRRKTRVESFASPAVDQASDIAVPGAGLGASA